MAKDGDEITLAYKERARNSRRDITKEEGEFRQALKMRDGGCVVVKAPGGCRLKCNCRTMKF